MTQGVGNDEHRLCGVPSTHLASRSSRAQCGLCSPLLSPSCVTEFGQLLLVCRGPCLLAVAPGLVQLLSTSHHTRAPSLPEKYR